MEAVDMDVSMAETEEALVSKIAHRKTGNTVLNSAESVVQRD